MFGTCVGLAWGSLVNADWRRPQREVPPNANPLLMGWFCWNLKLGAGAVMALLMLCVGHCIAISFISPTGRFFCNPILKAIWVFHTRILENTHNSQFL